MAMSGADRKRLWGRSGNQCAMPGCNRILTADIADYLGEPGGLESVTLGEEAHIVAESDNGPRANPDMPQSARDAYANRILLCEACHKVIDAADGKYFSVETLLEMKRDHEGMVEHGLGTLDREKQQAGELMARFADEWETRAGIADWEGWTSYLLTPQPAISRERFADLSDTAVWVGSRKLPTIHYPRIARGVRIFSVIWLDLVKFIDREFAASRSESELQLRAKHKETWWDQGVYRKLVYEYELNVHVLHELLFHASAAVNLLSDFIRDDLDAAYGFDRGSVTIVRGPDQHLRFQHFRPEYEGGHRESEDPYPGMVELMDLARDSLSPRCAPKDT